MPSKRIVTQIGWAVLFVLYIPAVYVGTAIIPYFFTGNKTLDVVLATTVTVLAIIGFKQVGKCGRVIAMTVILGLSVLILTGNAGASTKPATESRTSNTPNIVANFSVPMPPIPMPPRIHFFWHYTFGGQKQSKSVTENMGYAAIPGKFWFNIWVNGFSPFGTYKDDTFGMVVHWSGVNFMSKNRFGPTLGWRFRKKPTFLPYFKARPTAHFDQITQKVAHYMRCKVQGLWENHGCYYIKLTAEVTHAIPPAFISIITAYPTISVIINARGEIVRPYFSIAHPQF